jgi:hypothetical protein
MQNLCFGPEYTVSGYRSCAASILLHWSKINVWSVSEHLANLRPVTRCKTFVWWLNALFRGTEVVKHPFYSIGAKLMFGSVSEHLANLRPVTRCKTFVWWLNALFRGTEVVKHPFYSIGVKLMFGSVSENFANLQRVTRCKTCVPSLNALFRGTNVVKHLHWTQNDVWECFGAYR